MNIITGTSPASDRTALSQFLDEFDEVLYFPSIPWSFTWQRAQVLIEAFARAHPGKPGYVFPPLGLIAHSPLNWRSYHRIGAVLGRKVAFARGAARRAPSPSLPPPTNLTFVRGFFVPGTGSWRRSATLLASPAFRRLLRPQGRRLVLASYANELIISFADTCDFVILDLAERRQSNPLLSTQAKANERLLAARADVLVADNRSSLQDYAEERSRFGRASYYIPQGFTPSGKARHVGATESGPFAYLGNLHHAVDVRWLSRLAEAHPRREVRLCGRLLEPKAAQLLKLPNVCYWGEIPHCDIPRFLSGVSWGLIPYTLDEWTAGVFPTKLLEYLDCGIPVLSTALPEVQQFTHLPYVQTTSDPALVPPTPVMDGLDDFLAGHSWEARLDAYGRALLECRR